MWLQNFNNNCRLDVDGRGAQGPPTAPLALRARLDLRRNELPPKVVKMLAKQARGFRKESDDDVPLELLLEPQEKSEQAGQ